MISECVIVLTVSEVKGKPINGCPLSSVAEQRCDSRDMGKG